METLKPSNATHRRALIAPYITAWSAEQDPPYELIARPGVGIAYADETITDRDRNGVLWSRTPSRPGQGCPDFGRVHPRRQRRAMLRLLCQVCAGPADQTDEGVLWLLTDHRADWPNWPNRMGVTEPPICAPCVRTSMCRCPALRKSAVTVRARRYSIAGVHGALHSGPRLTTTDVVTVPLEDPTIRWVRAVSLVRELHDCEISSPTDLVNK